MGLPVTVGLEHEKNLERSPTEIRKDCWAATRILSEVGKKLGL